jgi:hypothetical protein
MQQVQFMGGSLVLMRDGEQEGDAISMAQKMMALANQVGQVEKDSTLKTNSYSFKYVSYEALALAVRQALHKVGLAFFVSTTGSVVDRDLTMSEGSLSFMDTETGAILSLPWRGQGQDSGDKGGNKALTTGVKYALMRTLLVSEDRDTDGDAEPSRSRADYSVARGQGFVAPRETTGEPIWQPDFYQWAGRYVEYQKLGPRVQHNEAVDWLIAKGHMTALDAYAALDMAQAAFIKGIPEYVKAQDVGQQQRDNAPQAERNSDPIPPARRPAPRNQGNAVREPESVRTSLQLRIASQIKAGKWAGSVADSKLVGAVASRMAEVFAGDPDDSIDIEAHQVVKFLFGKTSIKDLTDAEGRAVLGWTARKEGDEWILPDESRKEARNIVASLDAEGQEQLF